MNAQPALPAPGAPFPRIVGSDADGAAVELAPNNALVVLYRGHWCAHCRAQLAGLAREARAFAELGFRVIAISADEPAGCRAAQAATGGAITLVSDTAARFIAALDLATSDPQVQHLIAMPATFLVDADGVTQYRYLSRSADDRPKPALLLLAAERLADLARAAGTT